MTLTKDDKSWIRDTIIDALEEVVLPRFDEHDRRFDERDKRFDALERDIAEIKADVANLHADVRALRDDMRDVKQRLGNLEGQVQALEADVRALYAMIDETSDKKFSKLSLEKKLLKLHSDLLATAKAAGITLPR